MNDVEILENRFLEIIIKYPESVKIVDPRDFFDYPEMKSSDLDCSYAGACFSLVRAKHRYETNDYIISIKETQ